MSETRRQCKYCEIDVDKRISLLSESGEDLYIDGNGRLTLDETWEEQLNYCPMCGRKLAEE